jgi:hypothetical protein
MDEGERLVRDGHDQYRMLGRRTGSVSIVGVITRSTSFLFWSCGSCSCSVLLLPVVCRISGVESWKLRADLLLSTVLSCLSHRTISHQIDWSHHTTQRHTYPYRHLPTPILCSQPQLWPHSHSQSTTRNSLLDRNRMGTVSDLIRKPRLIWTPSLYQPLPSTVLILSPKPSSYPSLLRCTSSTTLSLVSLRYSSTLATLLPRSSVFGPRSSLLDPRYARTANSGKTTSPNHVKV